MPRGTSRLDDARLQGRLWTPAIFAPTFLVAWHDFSDLSTISANSGVIDSIRDKSGNGFTATQVTSRRPTLSQTAISYSPGTAGVRRGAVFSGAQCMQVQSALPASTKWSGFGVFQFGTVGAYQRIISLDTTLGGTDYLGGNSMALLTGGSAGSNQVIETYDNGDKGTATFRTTTVNQAHVGVTISDGVNSTAYADGAPGTPVAYVQTSKAPFLEIGADTGAADGQLTGAIGETLVTSGDVSTQTRQRIEGYLAWKWGTVDQLIASHPYKNRPPTIGG